MSINEWVLLIKKIYLFLPRSNYIYWLYTTCKLTLFLSISAMAVKRTQCYTYFSMYLRRTASCSTQHHTSNTSSSKQEKQVFARSAGRSYIICNNIYYWYSWVYCANTSFGLFVEYAYSIGHQRMAKEAIYASPPVSRYEQSHGVDLW